MGNRKISCVINAVERFLYFFAIIPICLTKLRLGARQSEKADLRK